MTLKLSQYWLTQRLKSFSAAFPRRVFQAIKCTGTDNQTITKRTYIKHKITNANTNKWPYSRTQKHALQNLILKQFICKNCSYQCVYDCAQLCYTIQHRTVLIIFPLILQAIIIAQMLSNGGEGRRAGLHGGTVTALQDHTSEQVFSFKA